MQLDCSIEPSVLVPQQKEIVFLSIASTPVQELDKKEREKDNENDKKAYLNWKQ